MRPAAPAEICSESSPLGNGDGWSPGRGDICLVPAYMKHPTNNVFGGFLTIYMVATAWATARPEREQLAFWIGLDLFLQPGARDFRQTTHCTASLAHVLRVVYRTGSFFLGQQPVFPAWLRGRLCFLVRPCCHWRC